MAAAEGKSPSSMPHRYTVSNSRPLAACKVIMVMASSCGSVLSMSDTSDTSSRNNDNCSIGSVTGSGASKPSFASHEASAPVNPSSVFPSVPYSAPYSSCELTALFMSSSIFSRRVSALTGSSFFISSAYPLSSRTASISALMLPDSL